MKSKNSRKIIVHILLLLGITITVFPFVWMILTSFKTVGEAMQIPPTIFPKKFLTDAYSSIVTALPFGRVYLNTIISTVVTTVVQVLFCSMAAYAFARIEFPFKNAIFGKIMLPLTKAGIVSLVIFTAKFAWNDFMWPLIVNTSMEKMTLGPALSTLQGQYTTKYPMQMAGAVMAVIPIIVLFFVFQKQFIEGVAQSGIKG